MAQAPIIDQEFLHRLERLTLHWQKSFPGLVGGRIPSRLSGAGQEFLDHRHFHQGDDLRSVNWRAFLRLEKLFLKMFQVEPRIPVRMLLDVSESMAAKFEWSRKLAAALSYIGLVRLDTICLLPFRDRLLDPHICSGGRHRFMPAADFLGDLTYSGRTNYKDVARQFASAYPQRGLLIVISDFMDDGDIRKPLQFLADYGHELVLIHVWAPEDREPPWDGELELVDAESGERLEISLDQSAADAYRDAFDEYAKSLNDLATRTGGRYIGISTSARVEEVLFDSLVRAGAVQ